MHAANIERLIGMVSEGSDSSAQIKEGENPAGRNETNKQGHPVPIRTSQRGEDGWKGNIQPRSDFHSMPEASSVGREGGRLLTGEEWRKETRLRRKGRCIPGSGSGRGRPAPRAVGRALRGGGRSGRGGPWKGREAEAGPR